VKGKLFLILAIALFAVSCVTRSSGTESTILLDQAIQKAAAEIGENANIGQSIALLNFSSASEQFSVYVLEELTIHLVRGRKVVVVDRKELDLIRREEQFQLSGEVSDESAQAIGKKLGAQLIVSGSLTDVGNEYRFRIKVLNVERAVIETLSSSDISPNEAKVSFLLADSGPGSPVRPVAAAVAKTAPAKKPSASANMALIKGGIFTMGSPANEMGRGKDENQHKVTLGSFYMGKYPVTLGEFRLFIETAGYRTDAEKEGNGQVWLGKRWGKNPSANWKNPGFGQEEKNPVVLVSWYDAIRYCNWLSEREGLIPAYAISGTNVIWTRKATGYRLPTEAEWEYSCRAGTTTRFWSGDDESTLAGKANILDRSAAKKYPEWEIPDNHNDGYAETSPAGSFAANPWGLFDMHGNIKEWCWDWYDTSYESGDQTDPTGRAAGSSRVVRGGGWCEPPDSQRSAYRDGCIPFWSANYIGFRVTRNAD